MPVLSLVSSLVMIALTELGDRTMLITLCLSAQYRRPWLVLVATVSALTISTVIGVIIGYLLSASFPVTLIVVLSGLMFLVLGLYSLWRSRSNADIDSATPSTFVGMISLVLVSELGDKSQIAILALAAQSFFPLMIFLGAMIGFILVNATGSFVGDRIAHRLSTRSVRLVTGVVFLLFGVLILIGMI